MAKIAHRRNRLVTTVVAEAAQTLRNLATCGLLSEVDDCYLRLEGHENIRHIAAPWTRNRSGSCGCTGDRWDWSVRSGIAGEWFRSVDTHPGLFPYERAPYTRQHRVVARRGALHGAVEHGAVPCFEGTVVVNRGPTGSVIFSNDFFGFGLCG